MCDHLMDQRRLHATRLRLQRKHPVGITGNETRRGIGCKSDWH